MLLAPAAAHAAADPLRPQQWHLDVVGAPGAWDATRGGGVVIAVIDTGVQADHPDLEGRVGRGRDFVEPGTAPDDENGHGTLVAGIIAATLDNGVGGVGVAPRSRLMPVRVLDADGRGDPADVARGIRWAVDNGADVINLSLTETPGTLDIGLITTDVERAITEAHEAGALVVGAAGNEGARSTPYGSGVPVLVVGATDRSDELWPDSNRDRRTLFAPGVEIVSTFSGGTYARADGTSFATPIVSAAAALLLELDPDAEPAQVHRRLADTAHPVGAGVGRLDVARAVGAARTAGEDPRPTPSPSTPPPPPPEPSTEPSPASPPPAAGSEPEPGALPQTTPVPEPEPEPVQAIPPTPEVTPLPEPDDAPIVAEGGTGAPVATEPPAPSEPIRSSEPLLVDDSRGGWPVGVASLLVATDVALLGALLRTRQTGIPPG